MRSEDGGGITISNVKLHAPHIWVERPLLTVEEGRSFEFVLRRNFTGPIGFVRYSVVFGTASPADIVPATDGVLVFNSSDESQRVRIAAIDDPIRENPETLRLVLDISGLEPLFWSGRTETEVTILDNDAFGDREFPNDEGGPIPEFPAECIPGPADEPCWPWPFPGPFPIPASPVPPFFEDFRIRVRGLSHPRPEDLLIWVQAPNGAATILLAGLGGVEPIENVDLLFSMTAAPIEPDALLSSGIFGPSVNPNLPLPIPQGVALGQLLGEGQGDWNLFLYDLSGVAPPEAGIEGWALSYSVELAPSLHVEKTPNGIELSWDTALSEGWSLAESPNLQSPWTPLQDQPFLSPNQDRWILPVVPTLPKNFYGFFQQE